MLSQLKKKANNTATKVGEVFPRRYTNDQRACAKGPMSVPRETFKTIPSATMWQGQNNNIRCQGGYRKINSKSIKC